VEKEKENVPSIHYKICLHQKLGCDY